MPTANRMTGNLLLSPLRLLASHWKIVECVTAALLPVRISRISLQNTGQKNSSKKRKTAVASTVSSIDLKEQLQAEMWSLGYVEVLFIYTIIHANKLPSQASCSISEFFCFAGMMEIFFTRNLEASVERNMRRGKGPRRPPCVRYCTWGHALCTYAVSARVFRHPSSKTFFFFFLGPVLFLVFNHGLVSFLFFSIHDTQNEHKRKLGVNKSQVANVNKRKRSNMKWMTPDVLPRKTSWEALTMTHFKLAYSTLAGDRNSFEKTFLLRTRVRLKIWNTFFFWKMKWG